MKKQAYKFSSQSVEYYFNAVFAELEKITPRDKTIIITDENIHWHHQEKLKDWKLICIHAGEVNKNQDTYNFIIQKLIELQADRSTMIVGLGGGVVTDMAGYVASTYMRGLKFGFVPTTILAMVDAAIGGKNGIDVGLYKNLLGIIRQPEFILYDVTFLGSLPQEEWVNGFAEIIKHACIKDAGMFDLLQKKGLESFQKDDKMMADLIERNAALKSKVVIDDEFENGERKLLNFGHTIGHGIENQLQLKHGYAVSIGMMAASKISEQLIGLDKAETARLKKLLDAYRLPTQLNFDREKVIEVMKMDKKKSARNMSFIVLKSIGEAEIVNVPVKQLEQLTRELQ